MTTPEILSALKATIRDGQWVYLPPPKQDKAWLERLAERGGK